MRRRLIALLALALVAGACGGDEELSFDEWVAEVNQLCADLPDSDDDEPTELSDFPLLASETAAEGKALLADVNELGTPGERADEVQEWKDEVSDAIEVFERLGRLDPSDSAAIQTELEAAVEAQQDVDQLSDRLGLDDCMDQDEDLGEIEVDDELGFVGSAYAEGLTAEGVPLDKARCIAKYVQDRIGKDRLLELSLEAADAPEGTEPPDELIVPTIAGADECGASELLTGESP